MFSQSLVKTGFDLNQQSILYSKRMKQRLHCSIRGRKSGAEMPLSFLPEGASVNFASF